MKAMILNAYGAEASFEAADLPEPVLKPGHVQLNIAATSVNTVDTMIRAAGKDLPLSPDLPALLGMDFAGTVQAVASDVSHFEPGDEVYGCAGGLADLPGALAESMVVDARLIARKPGSLTLRQAAALPLVGITAQEGLQRAGVSAGQKVLVHGGTGGVGHVAVQLAVAAGAEVFATVSNDAAADIVAGYGATPINYQTQSVDEYVAEHTGGAGFDVVYDSVGGANMVNSFAAATLNGHVVSTVSLLEMDLSLVHFKGLSLHVVFMLIPMLHNVGREDHGVILKQLAQAADAGALTPLLDERSFELGDAGAAYDHLVSGQAVGKIVINI
ncbi:MAG: zinc-dependent alcohol dehydrogenase family protein [Pseudomonadota bacterium]